jgi:imidazolonepropionase-like amidohydrolase
MPIALPVLAVLSLSLQGGQPAAQDTTAIAFVNVSVVPMDEERVLRQHTVIVRGDRIVQVGPSSSVRPPQGARVVNGEGKFLTPGLAEMHGHVPPPNAPAQFTDDVLFMYVANGITTVRGMLGAPGQLELRERARRGEVVSPTLYLAGPSFNGNSVGTAEQAERMVRQQHAEGWNLLKVHPGVPRAAYDAMARTAKEVGIRFGGHVPQDVGLLHAIEMGQETFDHVDGYLEHLNGAMGPIDDEELADVVRRTREAGAWIVPTMALWEVLLGTLSLEELAAYPELRYMPQQQVQQWTNIHRQRLSSPQFNATTAQRVIDNRMRILRALHEGGVRILMGTDAPQQFSVPGFSLHREFDRMAAAGMSPYDILKSGTSNVGEYFANEDRFGTIAPGQRADLLLLDANPLESARNLSRISGVMWRGNWLTKSEIDAELARIERR